MKVLCLPDPDGGLTVVDHVKLFPNHPALRFEYRVHEQILPALRRLGGEVCFTDIVIEHSGYQNKGNRAQKIARDQRILEAELQERPNDPFCLFNLASVHFELRDWRAAIRLYRESIARSDPRDSQVRKCYAMMAHCYRNLNDLEAALCACREGRGYYPDDLELLFHEGLIHHQRHDYPRAESCLERVLELASQPQNHFASIDTGIGSYKTCHNLASIYAEQGKYHQAEDAWRRAIADAPDFHPAYTGLCEMMLEQHRLMEAEEIADELLGKSNGSDRCFDGKVIKGRVHMAREDWWEARKILEEVRDEMPQAVSPHLFLSHLFLKMHDLQNAEPELRSVLRLNPNDAQAHYNLGGICLETNRKELALSHYRQARDLGHEPARAMLSHALAPAYPATSRTNSSLVANAGRILWINHHHIGDGLIQLGALKVLHERNPDTEHFYYAEREQARPWLKSIVDRIDWLTWCDENPSSFDGESKNLYDPPIITSLRGAWGAMIGVEEDLVQPYLPAVDVSAARLLHPAVICCPHAATNAQKHLPDEFWERVVELARSEDVVSYSMGASSDRAIRGTIRHHGLNVWDAAAYLLIADAVITVDNGLKWLAWAAGQRRIIELYNYDLNNDGWSNLGPPWTLGFHEATPEKTWEAARRMWSGDSE